MPLEAIDLANTAISDLSFFAGMPLKELRLGPNDTVADLSPLAAMPIESLFLDASSKGGQITDLSPLKGRPLRELGLNGQRQVTSLAPLAGCPLQRCELNGTQVADLAPLAKAPLRRLCLVDSQVTDLRPIQRAPLERLDLSPMRIAKGLPELRGMASLSQINGMPREDFFRFLEVHKAIAAANPAYAWDGKGTFENGRLAVGEFANLRSLACLKSYPLTSLRLIGGEVTDLAPLAGMASLRNLALIAVPATDLTPIASLPLESLELYRPRSLDLTLIGRMSTLRRLALLHTRVADLSPILGLQLSEFSFSSGFITTDQLDGLRRMPSLLRIGASESRTIPVAQFWRMVDTGELRKK
jgi:Leucine-rich repeat (LRR) protein